MLTIICFLQLIIISFASNKVIESRRLAIRANLWDYNDLEELIPEKGGTPIRNIIISTWRSGSSFVGELVASHPGSIFIYEPFMDMQSEQIHTKEEARDAFMIIKDLMNCEFGHERYKQQNGTYLESLFSRSPYLRDICRKVDCDSELFSKICKLYPFQVLKTVRLPLRFAEPLIADEGLNARFLLLVRDPRSIMSSRMNSKYWCIDDCMNENLLCSDQVSNYIHAVRLMRKYPKKLITLRHEDICSKPEITTKKLFSHFRLNYHPNVKHFINQHTIKNENGEFSTYRTSSQIPYKWIENFARNTTIYNKIQEICENAMDAWGYRKINISIIKTNETLKFKIDNNPYMLQK